MERLADGHRQVLRRVITSSLCLVTERVMPTVSHSWKASLPIAAVGTWPVMATIGIESM